MQFGPVKTRLYVHHLTLTETLLIRSSANTVRAFHHLQGLVAAQ
jgi:hypothetical protein